MAREPSGRHGHTGSYPALRPVTAEEMGVELVRGEASGPPGWVRWAAEKFGLPTLLLGVSVYLGVQLFQHNVREAAAVRVHHDAQIDKILKAQKERDEAMVKAIEKLSNVLDELPRRLKGRGRDEVAERGRR